MYNTGRSEKKQVKERGNHIFTRHEEKITSNASVINKLNTRRT